MAHEHLINADERLDVGAKHAKTNKTAATPSKAGAILQALVWVCNEGCGRALPVNYQVG